MIRTRIKVIIAAALLLAALAWWWPRDPRGSVIARSTSPDGRWRILVYEHRPNLLLLEQSPYIYTFSLSSTPPESQPSMDLTYNNDSSVLVGFQIDWTPNSATVFWGRQQGSQGSARADISRQPIHWIERQ